MNAHAPDVTVGSARAPVVALIGIELVPYPPRPTRDRDGDRS
jgi:hypothetical protein